MTRARIVWALLALALLLDAWWPVAPGATRADFGRTNSNLIIEGLGFLFGLFSGKVDKAIKRTLETLRDGLLEFGKTLAAFALDTGAMMAKLVGLIRRFWSSVILPVLRKFDLWVTRLFRWLRDTFGPIIDFLIRVRNRLLAFYQKWFAPIFATIDVIRRILQIGSFLGIEAARKLDRKLAELERRLRLPIEEALNRLNLAIDTINRIVTLDGFLQRYTLLRSLGRDIGRLGAIYHAAHTNPVTASERAPNAALPPSKTQAQSVSDFRRWLQTGEGPHTASLREWSAELSLRLRGG